MKPFKRQTYFLRLNVYLMFVSSYTLLNPLLLLCIKCRVTALFITTNLAVYTNLKVIIKVKYFYLETKLK